MYPKPKRPVARQKKCAPCAASHTFSVREGKARDFAGMENCYPARLWGPRFLTARGRRAGDRAAPPMRPMELRRFNCAGSPVSGEREKPYTIPSCRGESVSIMGPIVDNQKKPKPDDWPMSSPFYPLRLNAVRRKQRREISVARRFFSNCKRILLHRHVPGVTPATRRPASGGGHVAQLDCRCQVWRNNLSLGGARVALAREY